MPAFAVSDPYVKLCDEHGWCAFGGIKLDRSVKADPRCGNGEHVIPTKRGLHFTTWKGAPRWLKSNPSFYTHFVVVEPATTNVVLPDDQNDAVGVCDELRVIGRLYPIDLLSTQWPLFKVQENPLSRMKYKYTDSNPPAPKRVQVHNLASLAACNLDRNYNEVVPLGRVSYRGYGHTSNHVCDSVKIVDEGSKTGYMIMHAVAPPCATAGNHRPGSSSHAIFENPIYDNKRGGHSRHCTIRLGE